jgi:hypothetical protein
MEILAIYQEHDPALFGDLQLCAGHNLVFSQIPYVLKHQQFERRSKFNDPVMAIDHVNNVWRAIFQKLYKFIIAHF